MNQFSIWPRLGFRENPYSNQNLPADEVGDALLAGREAEVAEIQRKIGSGGTHLSVEGVAGVGKSSMLAVAAYRMQKMCVQESGGTLFLPATRFFQASNSLDELEQDVYTELAQTLIANVDAFRLAGVRIPDVAALDRWLNNAQFVSGSIGGLGFSGGGGTSPNETEGFSNSGFPKAVRGELSKCFPTAGAGAVVCVLDNLELLQTSGKARDVLEALRNRLFDMQGLRWILCGSRGIVSRARSQRLSGFFDAPMIVDSLPHDAAVELVSRRINYYGASGAYAPVPPDAFEYLYRALHLNLRDAMAYAQQFSDWLYGQYIARSLPVPPLEDRFGLLEAWLSEVADSAFEDARGIQRRVWQFFDLTAEREGVARASDWEDFGFSTQQQHSGSVSALENANLVVREVDPENAARSIAVITPQGWLVYFNRSKYALPGHADGAPITPS